MTHHKPTRRRAPPLDPWGATELADFVRKMCGTLFRVGELEDKEDGSRVFWVLLPDDDVVRMARVTVTKKLDVTVAVRGAKGSKVETLLQENLQSAIKRGGT